MKIFNLKLKNSYFLGEPFRVFRHCFFGCFHFFMFSFLKMCLGVFIVDCICSLHCVVVMRVLRMWDSIFYSHTFFFYLALLPDFIKASLRLPVLPWRLQGFPMRFETRTHPICLFELHSIWQLRDKWKTPIKLVKTGW